MTESDPAHPEKTKLFFNSQLTYLRIVIAVPILIFQAGAPKNERYQVEQVSKFR